MKNNLSLKYSLILFLLLSSFFTIMWAFGQADKTWLRLFNGVIHIGLLYFAILNYRKENPETTGNYLSGVGLGMTISLIGSILFGLFIALFINIDPHFAAAIESKMPNYANLPALSAALFVIVEGIAAGLIGSYLMTRVINAQLLKQKTGQADYNKKYENNSNLNQELT